MLKFFRRIRQQLLKENKFSKYLVYAVGEIILVVFGILIALQINTAKQQKEDRSFELMMLSNIRNEIASDINFCEFLQDRLRQIDQAAQDLLQSYGTDDDSLVLQLYPVMSMGISFEYRKGAYEALKSTGLDKISNDSIRDGLTLMYDFGLPRVSRWLDEFDRYQENVVQETVLQLFAPEIITDEEGNRSTIRGLKVKKLLQDSRFLRLIVIYQYRAREQMRILEVMIPQYQTGLTQLNKELKDSYPFQAVEE